MKGLRHFGHTGALGWPFRQAESIKVMAKAMVNAGYSDPAKYLPAMKSITYKGATGDISFNEKGDTKNGALTLYTYKAGGRSQIAVVR